VLYSSISPSLFSAVHVPHAPNKVRDQKLDRHDHPLNRLSVLNTNLLSSYPPDIPRGCYNYLSRIAIISIFYDSEFSSDQLFENSIAQTVCLTGFVNQFPESQIFPDFSRTLKFKYYVFDVFQNPVNTKDMSSS
jgi:hypothetical protein